MTSIRFQFSRQADLASDAIAWFTQGTFSHVDAVLPSGELLGARSDHIGGKPSGVQIRPHDYAKWAQKVTFEVPVSEQQKIDFWNFLYHQIGKPYDTKAIWGFVLGRYWREDDSWICSELQASASEHAKITPKLYLATNKITPVSWALTVSALPGVKIV